ncbi:hypothetical protein [Planctomicrobium piriforme]|uniref:EamA domain-containing protein n=1 Tax=Planctomicrobium piriforme TaxID=1576369 RepID=A0A1I3IAY1_9PLAN|nr:hypothetical protein [Planctomicrobium piriforme]SFI45165.1 hypothetical protein SAMN05421753_10946 [Planctomicrobium piriforme]
MTSKQLALLIGGLIPAVALGFAAVCQKLASQQGIGAGPFLIVGGLVISAVGGVFLLVERDATIQWQAAGYTALFALCWATATGLISFALRKLGGSMSQLVPIYNMNTLIAVLAGLVLLAEWKTVSPPKILAAAVLIIAGGVLAARS